MKMITSKTNPKIKNLVKLQKAAERREQIEKTLAAVGIAHKAEALPKRLSEGEQQRVGLARALINNPDVILADEPSGSLDSKNKEELHQLFFDLRDKYGQTFVIVTHDEQLASITDRTIHMRDGLLEKLDQLENLETIEEEGNND